VFEPYLTCKVFGLVETPSNWHLDVARKWSRQPLRMEPDGSIQWDSETDFEIEREHWYRVPSAIRFSAHNALIPLGHLENAFVIAFVSPVSVVPVSFRNSAPRYLQRDHPGGKVVDLTVQLDQIAKNDRFVIRAIEGTAPDGLRVAWRADEASSFRIRNTPSLKEFHTLDIDIQGKLTKLDDNYNISISDVSEEYTEVTSCLRGLFNLLHQYKLMSVRSSAQFRSP
jgi:hypothetical protein